MSGVTIETLLNDLLYHIISYLQIRDIVRLRQVSTHFACVTRERTVWLTAYRNATVLRPPGPFIYQSTKDLEEYLVKATELHGNWMSPSPRPVISREFIPAGRFLHDICNIKLVLGRFLLVGESDLLACYDLDSDHNWNSPIASYATSFDTLDYRITTDADGKNSATIALFAGVEFSSSVTVLTMQLPPSFVTFRLEFTTKTEWRSGRLNAAIEDDYLVMYTPSEVKIFHLPTRRYYCVPESGSGFSTLTNSQYHEYRLTSTHLIDFHPVMRGAKTVIQAFLLPHADDQREPSSNPFPVLTRTHVGHCDFTFTESKPLHSHAMDPGVYTFMAFESASTPPGRLPTDNLIIVDTFFTSQGNSFGTVTATKRHTKELGNMNYNIMHTSQGDITRAVTFTGMTTFTICGFTIVNDADGINIERRALPLDLGRPMQVAIGVFDGYRGRLCLVLESPIRIQVYDYVGFKI